MRRSGDKPNIAVITGISDSIVSETILANFIDLLKPISHRIYAITGRYSCESGDKVRTIRMKGWGNDDIPILKILKYWLIQLKICSYLFKIARDIDIVIIYFGTRGYVLPLFTAKVLRKKTVSCFTGLASSAAKLSYGKWLFGLGGILFPSIARILERINLLLADQVHVESPCGIISMGLEAYREKIIISGRYVDIDSFRVTKGLQDRENLVGYIGRLSTEKGVMNLAKAMPSILKQHNGIEFFIGGNGPLFEQLKTELEENGAYDKTEMVGWIPHQNLPEYFNKLRLILLPSFIGEGLPGVVQEAMACGTPVLATPVGGVPDLVKDGETGFIMEDNSPECIARNVTRALNHPKLDEIGQNACRLIQQEYSYQIMVEKCRHALEELMKGKS